MLLGASDRYAHALHALDAWTQAPQMAPFALLDATLALDSDGSWLRQALPPVAQRLRDAVETFASDTTEAAAYAGDVQGWLKLTGYAGDAAATARALRCQVVDTLTLTDGGETLAAAQVLTAVKPPDLARLGRLREVQGRLDEAAETFEAADMPADALRNWRTAGKWQQAVRLAEGQERSDLQWLVELDTLARRRPAGQRKRLTGGERECLVQLARHRRAASQERQDRDLRVGAAARHTAVARPGAAARLPRGRRLAAGPGQVAHRPVLRPARDGSSRTGRSPPTPGGA